MKINNNIDIVSIYNGVLQGEIKKFPHETWSHHKDGFQNAKRCGLFLFNEVLQWDKNDILENLDHNIFKKYRLTGAVGILFNHSPYDFINYVFPDLNIKPWELKNTPLGFWNEDNLVSCIKYIVLSNGWNREEILHNIHSKALMDAGLGKIMMGFRRQKSAKSDAEESRVYDLIKLAFPEHDYKVWELNRNHKWNDEDRVSAIKWLVEEKLNWNYEECRYNLRLRHFRENGIYSVSAHFGQSVYRAMKSAYPELDWNELKSSRISSRNMKDARGRFIKKQ